MKKQLYRSKDNTIIGGVCSGIAEYFDTDPTLIRLLWAFFALYGGIGIVAYIVCLIVMPEDKGVSYDRASGTSENAQDLYVSKTPDNAKRQGTPGDPEAYTPSKGNDKGPIFAGVFLICIGGLLLFKKIFQFSLISYLRKWLHFINLSRFWPILLIIAGLGILLKEIGRKGRA